MVAIQDYYNNVEFFLCYARKGGRAATGSLCCIAAHSQDRVICSLLPGGEEWRIVGYILKPFAIATTVLSGSSYTTISIVYPLIYKFCSSLDGKEDDSEIANRSKQLFSLT